MHHRLHLALAILGAPLLLSFGSRAALAQSCSVSATASAFGQYSPTSAFSDDTTATVSVACSSSLPKLVTYTLAMSPGLGGSYAGRSLKSGANSLAYQIYTDLTRSIVWGDGTGGTSVVNGSLASIAITTVQLVTAFARIPARQNVAPGAYTDLITVTVTY